MTSRMTLSRSSSSQHNKEDKASISLDSLLQLACSENDLQFVFELLQFGCDIDNKKYSMQINDYYMNGVAPLHVAVFHNDSVLTEMLLQQGANPNSITGINDAPEDDPESRLRNHIYYTAMHIAVITNKRQMVELLIKYDAQLDIEDHEHRTPLEYAVITDAAVMALLIAHGANINRHNLKMLDDKMPLLFIAIERGNLEMVDILVDVSERDLTYCDQTPIEFALSRLPECVEYLIKKGYDVRHQNWSSKETVLHEALRTHNHIWLKLILERSVDVNVRDCKGNTLVHHAIYNKCSPDILLLLISHGAHPDLINDYHSTALWYALEDESIELAEILLRYGAKLSESMEELQYAIECHKPKAVTLILKNTRQSLRDCHLESTLKRKDGKEVIIKTPILWHYLKYCFKSPCETSDLVKVLHALIEHGCDINSVHKLWGTFLHSIIYVMQTDPHDRWKDIFKEILEYNHCDINQIFVPQDCFHPDKPDEYVFASRIAPFGTSLAFAISPIITEGDDFFAEYLLSLGADPSTIDWKRFNFSPSKVKLLKMIFLSGHSFSKSLLDLIDPSNNEKLKQELILNPVASKQCREAYDAFRLWINEKSLCVNLSLKDLSRRIIRKHCGRRINEYVAMNANTILVTVGKFLYFNQ